MCMCGHRTNEWVERSTDITTQNNSDLYVTPSPIKPTNKPTTTNINNQTQTNKKTNKQTNNQIRALLDEKVSPHKNPWLTLKINYGPQVRGCMGLSFIRGKILALTQCLDSEHKQPHVTEIPFHRSTHTHTHTHTHRDTRTTAQPQAHTQPHTHTTHHTGREDDEALLGRGGRLPAHPHAPLRIWQLGAHPPRDPQGPGCGSGPVLTAWMCVKEGKESGRCSLGRGGDRGVGGGI
jgi:hypothetical protein